MFDEIQTNFFCWVCNKKIECLQTKALDKSMNYIKIGDTIVSRNFHILEGSIEAHGLCGGCKTFYDCFVQINNGKLTEKIYITNILKNKE